MQATIKKPFSIEGIGIHTGKKTKITVKPDSSGSGITFCQSGVKIPAIVSQVNDTKHGVTLKSGKLEIKTCEHLLSALYGLNVDNAICEIEGDEIPALDGSCLKFAELIKETGIEYQKLAKKWIELKEPIFLSRENASIFAIPNPEFKLSFLIDYPHPGINTQYKSFTITPEVYFNEIASARTYSFIDWVDGLKAKGLIRGGSLENSIVITKNGPINPLRFPDEPVRHKILDLIGDLALLGAKIKGWVFAIKSGHTLNVEFVRKILGVH
ncbi:UDP-3-O-[3-hydroxymyristoyl] N-acetylglucosamine deacetylase [candidate division WOR-3 bacterium]|nr:UDP-3-O-[3-hydroxymyristoyl] N-acetylglucosamine deacetylase [candidate division WOR-3 bacterium]